MIRLTPIISAGLMTVFVPLTSLKAQKADTLKRQLQVVTSEKVKLSEQKALPLALKFRVPETPTLPAFQPSSLLKSESFQASPYKMLSPLQTLLPCTQDLGFVRLGLGVKYNAYLSAGVRPIHSDKSVLDIYLDGRYTRYQLEHPLFTAEQDNSQIKEHRYSLGAQYTSVLGDDHSLGLKAEYSAERHNYNAHPTATLKHNQLVLSGSLENARAKDADWTYSFTPSFRYVSVNGLRNMNRYLDPAEGNLKLEGMLGYKLSETMLVGADLGIQTIFYGDDSYRMTLGYGIEPTEDANSKLYNAFSPFSSFTLRPFITLGHEERLSARLGLRLDNYSFDDAFWDRDKPRVKRIKIAPDVHVRWTFAPSWRADLHLTGELKPNALGDLLQEMPYLNLYRGATPTYSPIKVDLGVSGLITPALSLKAYAEYQSYLSALNYLASEWRENSPVLFEPLVQESGSRMTLGLGLQYRMFKRLSVNADARLNKWSDGLYGRPKMELDLGLVYKPTDKLELNASYALSYGIKQLVMLSPEIATGNSVPHPALDYEVEALRTYSLAQFGLSYELLPRLSVSLFGHLIPDASSTLYYGYTPQRISANLGVAYRF